MTTYTLPEASYIVRLPLTSLRAAVEAGKLPAIVAVGAHGRKHFSVTLDGLDAWVQARERTCIENLATARRQLAWLNAERAEAEAA